MDCSWTAVFCVAAAPAIAIGGIVWYDRRGGPNDWEKKVG